MLKLGHIIYSNCFPPHAGIVTGKVAFPFKLVDGIPTELNHLLYEGAIDVSPSSSIEYAMNPGRYLLLPDLSITSKKKVMSILFESKVPIGELDDRVVALTTASATSVVLLRILLEVRYGVNRSISCMSRALRTPQTAQTRRSPSEIWRFEGVGLELSHRYDLAELWHEWTGLPFVLRSGR
jgi:chorismate dehydratase